MTTTITELKIKVLELALETAKHIRSKPEKTVVEIYREYMAALNSEDSSLIFSRTVLK